MRNKIIAASISLAAIAAGAFVGYKLATDAELRGRLTRGARDVYQTSKKRVGDMTEDVAVRTAKMTKNPKINQEWVSNQWESIGY
ncbi:hypothetical protein [Candidatus Collinsella stercoripullorum]|uniref:hypothetical protein n=1 Tax=Candidatus Collinsella stercoripullorum TaxID=2838522 RepID=UPI0022E46322|nr:hypothetical protein [Candidatus Collinsella stercoripullorum]